MTLRRLMSLALLSPAAIILAACGSTGSSTPDAGTTAAALPSASASVTAAASPLAVVTPAASPDGAIIPRTKWANDPDSSYDNGKTRFRLITIGKDCYVEIKTEMEDRGSSYYVSSLQASSSCGIATRPAVGTSSTGQSGR